MTKQFFTLSALACLTVTGFVACKKDKAVPSSGPTNQTQSTYSAAAIETVTFSTNHGEITVLKFPTWQDLTRWQPA